MIFIAKIVPEIFLPDGANNNLSPANYTVYRTYQRNAMRIVFRCIVIAVLFAAGSLLFCSFDESTSLGSEIINDVNPDKVNVGRHYREYVMDSSGFVQKSSIARTDEIIHTVTSGVMVLGNRNGESSFGVVRFICPPDTDTTSHKRVFYRSTDSLLTVKFVFSRVGNGQEAHLNLYYNAKDTLDTTTISTPDTASMPFVGSIGFAGKDTVLDTVEIIDSTVRTAIFEACTTTEISAFPGTRFSFDIISQENDSLLRLYGSTPKLLVLVDKDTLLDGIDTATVSYNVNASLYVVKEDSLLSKERQAQPVSSYAPYRAAVFEYDPSSLWAVMEDTATSTLNRLISAGFMIRHPDGDTNTLYVQYAVSAAPLQSGREVDSIFNSSSVLITIPGDTVVFANVREPLQRYARQNPRPASLFLYLRLSFNTSAALSSEEYEQWRTVTWDAIPYLKTIIYQP